MKHPNFFTEESRLFDERVNAFLAKFRDGGLERLLDKWTPIYFGRQSECMELDEFRQALKSMVKECIAYLSRPRNETRNDWDEVHRIHWIKEKYQELFSDDSNGRTEP
jgi:hypothetical protein